MFKGRLNPYARSEKTLRTAAVVMKRNVFGLDSFRFKGDLKTRSMAYERFELKLSGNHDSGFFAEVLHAPPLRRTEPAPLDLPFSELRAWREALNRNGVSQQATLALGKQLYVALFEGEILRLWESSKAIIGAGGGLRLRLDIRSPELALVPWEIIHDGCTYLALTVTTPIVRGMSFHRPARIFDRETAPNVLLVTSSPTNAQKLSNLEAEVTSIERSLSSLVGDGRLGSCDVLSHATRQSLQYKLSHANYEVVHYIGHGAFDGQSGYLELEDETGRTDRVDAVTLAQFFTDTSVRLLFLNSCETAIPSPVEASRGTAEANLVVGIPAVVAMSAVVMDGVASKFGQVFYKELVEEHSIEYCMTEARKAITNYLTPYWAIPVLFTNATDSAPPVERGPTVVINQHGKKNQVTREITEINYYSR